jgi:hypothetical protein
MSLRLVRPHHPQVARQCQQFKVVRPCTPCLPVALIQVPGQLERVDAPPPRWQSDAGAGALGLQKGGVEALGIVPEEDHTIAVVAAVGLEAVDVVDERGEDLVETLRFGPGEGRGGDSGEPRDGWWDCHCRVHESREPSVLGVGGSVGGGGGGGSGGGGGCAAAAAVVVVAQAQAGDLEDPVALAAEARRLKVEEHNGAGRSGGGRGPAMGKGVAHGWRRQAGVPPTAAAGSGAAEETAH